MEMHLIDGAAVARLLLKFSIGPLTIEQADSDSSPVGVMWFVNVATLTLYAGLLAIEVDDLRKPDCRYVRRGNEEAYRSADVVLSGTILQINVAPWARVLRAIVRVRRLWKGEGALPKRQPHRDIVVEGFRDPRFCSDHIAVKDTKIFFLRKTGATIFLVNWTAVPINLDTIDELDSIRLGIANYTAKEIDKIGCERIRCDFKATCQLNEADESPECVCQFKCENITKPVCGTDHSTYANECELYATQCAKQKRLSVLYRRACEAVSPCDSVKCLYGSRCKEVAHNKTAQCVCPEHCPMDVAEATICADDGMDYASACEMERRSCKLQRPVRLKFMGKCDPCSNVTCPEYTICKVGSDRTPRCRCSDRCPTELKPVCASNNKTYRNVCFMKLESCRLYQELSVLYDGACRRDFGPCKKHNCTFGQICSSAPDGRYSCVCQFNCQPIFNPVCGKGGITYDNECQLLKAACEEGRNSSLLYEGPCLVSLCARKRCPDGGKCILRNGETVCICPHCNYMYDPVCASNRLTYENECEMRRHACLSRAHLFVLYKGICGGCENMVCDYYAQCVGQATGFGECRCPSVENCGMDNETVCGTDGVTYPSVCALKSTACKQRTFVMVASKGTCDYCRGKRCDSQGNCSNGNCSCPTHCAPSTTKESVCASDGHLYPSVCYMRKAACRRMITLQAMPMERCNRASLTAKENTKGELTCLCNRLGSLGETCDKDGKCRCRNHVIGEQCDQCEPGFWGFRLNARSSVGCIPCNCSSMGSLRNDCEQTSGRCVCKPGVIGLKCDKCLLDTDLLASDGCQSSPTKLLSDYKASDAKSAALKSSSLFKPSGKGKDISQAGKLHGTTHPFTETNEVAKPKDKGSDLKDHGSPFRSDSAGAIAVPSPDKPLQIAEFRGNGYVAVRDVHTAESSSYQRFDLHLCAKRQDGTILHTVSVNGSGQYDGGDFFSLLLTGGRMFVQFNLGAGVTRIGPSWKLAMNRWQRVLVERNLSSVTLSMNGKSRKVDSPVGLNKLNVHPNVVYFGGVPNRTIIPLAAPLYSGLHGFIHGIFVEANKSIDLLDSKNVLHQVGKVGYPICNKTTMCNTDCRCIPGQFSAISSCSDDTSLTAGVQLKLDENFGGVYHFFPKAGEVDCRSYRFLVSLNTTFLDGTVLIEQLGEGNNEQLVLIRLVNGLPTVFVKTAHSMRPLMQSGIFVADGLWHEISLSRVNEEMEITVDGQPIINTVARLGDSGLCGSSRLLIGAFHRLIPSSTFLGLSDVLNACVKNLQIQGVPVDFVMGSTESIGVPTVC